MKFQRSALLLSLLTFLALGTAQVQAQESIVFIQVGPVIPSGLGDQRIFGIEDVGVNVNGKFLAQAGYEIEYGKHVNAGARIGYTRLEYEYDYSGLENPPFALPSEDESAVLLMQGLVEYRFNTEGFTPLFGVSGGFIFGGPDIDNDTFDDQPIADFIFGAFGGITFPLAPELRGYVLLQGDFPLSSEALPNIYGFMAGIAFELE